MNICRSTGGHIKLWYKIEDSDLAHDNSAFLLFIRMLFMAHYKSDFASIRFAGEQYKLKAGEFSASISELAEHVNMSVSTTRKVLDRLEKDKRITRRTDRQTTVFSICNWDIYQGDQRQKIANDRANEVANDRANEVANEVANDRANVTGGQKKLKKEKKLKKLKKVNKFDLALYQETLDFWSENAGRTLSDSKASREAFKKLIESRSIEEIHYAILGAIYFQGKPYKPQVMSLTSLYEKWDSLTGYMQNEKKEVQKHEENRF